MSVDFKRKDFLLACSKYHQVRDVIDGDQRLKLHDYNAQNLYSSSTASNSFNASFWDDNYNGIKSDSYLRRVNPKDPSDDNKTRNAQYIKCAVFSNFTKHTSSGMNGMMFRRAPSVNLGSTIEYLINDADGSGQQLGQQIKNTGRNVVEVGRHGLLVDFPDTNGPSSVKDVANGQRSYIDTYQAEQIINWRVKKFGAVTKLILVVLQELESIEDDVFNLEERVIYRVLRLDKDGKYIQEVYRTGSKSPDEIFEPKLGNGQRLDFIPFQFVGSEDNSPSIDGVTMYDISVVNIGHYRNSADVEENSFFASQMTLTATGMTQQWIADVWKGEAQIGSRAVLTGPDGANFGSIQANESNLARKLMEDKEKQMIQLGAKLIEAGQGNKTATQAEIDSADSSSILSTIAANVEDAYINAISWVQLFMNDNQDFTLELNQKFGVAQLSAQDITAIVKAWQAGAISQDSMLWNFKQGHRIPAETSAEDEKGLIETGGKDFDLEGD